MEQRVAVELLHEERSGAADKRGPSADSVHRRNRPRGPTVDIDELLFLRPLRWIASFGRDDGFSCLRWGALRARHAQNSEELFPDGTVKDREPISAGEAHGPKSHDIIRIVESDHESRPFLRRSSIVRNMSPILSTHSGNGRAGSKVRGFGMLAPSPFVLAAAIQ